MDNNVLKSLRYADNIEYFVFPSEISDKDERALQKLKDACNNAIKRYLNGYLWHKDPFKLTVRTGINNYLNSVGEAEVLPSHLYGCTDCGDNIDDEWFIVFLLIELTKQIEGITVRVVDADGEFLLIEAADYLPQWATPEICDKRVYLHKGLVHIVSPEENEENQQISIEDALKEIKTNSALTVASPKIQESIKNKLKMYPNAITENLHHAKAYLPIAIATILNHKPNLISPAIQAFCNRDPIDLKACRSMKYFPPENRVYVQVKFTKHLYAMLVHSKYIPDRKIGWNLPLVNDENYKSHLLGVKIACGFEILANQASKNNNLDCNKAWNVYYAKLQETNYFRGLLEHSKEYNELLNKAKEHFSNNKDDFDNGSSVGDEILNLTKSLDCNADFFKELVLPEDDDESWLDISPQELEKMLMEKYGKPKMFNFGENSSSCDFAKKVNEFLEHVSGVEGAEFPLHDIQGDEQGLADIQGDLLENEGLSKNNFNLNENGASNFNLQHKEYNKNGFDTQMDVDSVESSTEKKLGAKSKNLQINNSNVKKVSFNASNASPQEKEDCNGHEDGLVAPQKNLQGSEKNSKQKNSTDKISPKVNFDVNAFSCAIQNILNLVIPEDDDWGTDSDSDMESYAHDEDNADLKKKMEQYMKEMDRELAGTTIGESFVPTETLEDKFDDVESFKPVDIDKNALKNILESYRSQLGEAGPSSNMLGPMGVHLDPKDDEEIIK